MMMFSVILNLLKIYTSFVISSLFKISFVWGYPSVLGIELTNNCNLRCPQCPSGAGILTRPSGFMSEELLEKIVKEFKGTIYSCMFYFQGESMMHPKFLNMLEKAIPLHPVISTNGHFLNSENCKSLAKLDCKKIIVSMDGISDATYNKYRVGGNFVLVREGLLRLDKELKKRNRNGILEIQTLVSSSNENEMDMIAAFAKQHNIRLRFKSMLLYSDEIELLPGISRYKRYKSEKGKLVRRGRLSNRCKRLWTNPVITWDGMVVPCCFDKDADYSMGNLNSQSFNEIWNGEKYIKFRHDILHNRAGIDICRNCTSSLPPGIRK